MINEQSLKDRLHLLSKEKELPFNACWKQLILERFLARLYRSNYANKLIFKGGFLLAYIINMGRETIDLDFLLTKIKAEVKNLESICKEIVQVSYRDGFIFAFASIPPHMGYPGYRITLNVSFGKMKDKIHIDIGIGDAVDPENLEINLLQCKNKPLFEESISLLVYPIESIFAEKLETVLSKGGTNSRMKDYHDLFLIAKNKKITNSKKLYNALASTFKNRGTTLAKIHFDSDEIGSLQKLWLAHLRGLGGIAQELQLPENLNTLIKEVNYLLQVSLSTNLNI